MRAAAFFLVLPIAAIGTVAAFAQTATPVVKKLPKDIIRKAVRTVETRTFQPAGYGPVCPTQLVAGDREFDGHGPEVWLTANAYITADQAVEVRITMRARETRHDWSETAGSWTRRLTPPEMKVRRILSDTRSEANFVSTGARMQVGSPLTQTIGTPVTPSIGTLVNKYYVVGDTGGPDISEDENCRDDTSVRVEFNALRLEVYR